MTTAAEIATVSATVMLCLSSSGQLVAANPPGAVRGAEENKSIKAGALLLTPLIRGGAEP